MGVSLMSGIFLVERLLTLCFFSGAPFRASLASLASDAWSKAVILLDDLESSSPS